MRDALKKGVNESKTYIQVATAVDLDSDFEGLHEVGLISDRFAGMFHW